MFQNAAVTVVEELAGRGAEGGGVDWAERLLARKATERSRRKNLGGMREPNLEGPVREAVSELIGSGNVQRPTLNVQHSTKRGKRLPAADDFGQLFERGLLGFGVIVVT